MTEAERLLDFIALVRTRSLEYPITGIKVGWNHDPAGLDEAAALIRGGNIVAGKAVLKLALNATPDEGQWTSEATG